MLDWINAIYPVMIEDGSETTAYLVKDRDSNEATENWLKLNFNDIFENELNDRHSDEGDWPQKRTYKLFADWFDVEIHTMVLDIEDSPIIKY